MNYADLKAQSKKKRKQIMSTPPSNTPTPPIDPPQQPLKKDCNQELLEDLVKDKYKGIKQFYDDINDPTKIVPNREELKQSLNDLLLAKEKVKFNEMILQYDDRIKKYKTVVEALLQIVDLLLHINE